MTGYPLPHLRKLVIAVHDHRDVESGVEWGRALAAVLHLPITFVTVIEGPQAPATVPQREVMARDALEIVRTDSRLRGLDVDYLVLTGDPAELLPDVVAGEQGSVLILATDREPDSDRSLAEGSRLRRLLRNMRTSYMLLPEDAAMSERVHCIVVGYDQSRLAGEVLRTARSLGQSFDVDVIAVEAIEPGMLPDDEFLTDQLIIEERMVRARGLASRTLLAVARARDAAVIVVGSHGVGTSPQALMGSTTAWLAHNADRPVLVVPER